MSRDNFQDIIMMGIGTQLWLPQSSNNYYHQAEMNNHTDYEVSEKHIRPRAA